MIAFSQVFASSDGCLQVDLAILVSASSVAPLDPRSVDSLQVQIERGIMLTKRAFPPAEVLWVVMKVF